MTALDQAFIRAFSPKGAAEESTRSAAPRPAVPLSQALASPILPTTTPTLSASALPALPETPPSNWEPVATTTAPVSALREPRGVRGALNGRSRRAQRLDRTALCQLGENRQPTAGLGALAAAQRGRERAGGVFGINLPGRSCDHRHARATGRRGGASATARRASLRHGCPGRTAHGCHDGPRRALLGRMDRKCNARRSRAWLFGDRQRIGRHRSSPEPEPDLPQSMETGVVPPPHLNLWQAEAGQPSANVAAAPPTPLPTTDRPWQPMLQVEHYVWPKICFQLHMVAVRSLDQVADAMSVAVRQGHKVVGVGGCRAGDGATTMLLCAARQLARRGLRVVMVDGTFADPQLATRLGLLPQDGWESVLAGNLPLEEVVIDSLDDRLALLPVIKPQSGVTGLMERNTAMAASLDTLARHYDVVLVDLGPLEDCFPAGASLTASHSRLDAAIVVTNPRSDGPGAAGGDPARSVGGRRGAARRDPKLHPRPRGCVNKKSLRGQASGLSEKGRPQATAAKLSRIQGDSFTGSHHV